MAFPTKQEMEEAGRTLTGQETAEALAFWGGLKLIAERNECPLTKDGEIRDLRERFASAPVQPVALGSDVSLIECPVVYPIDRDVIVAALDLIIGIGERVNS